MSLIDLNLAYEKAVHSPARRMDLIEELQREGYDLDRGDLERFLVEVLGMDPDPIVRHEAAFAMGRLKTRDRIGGNVAAPALCASACKDSSLVVRHEATETLHCFEGKEVERTLVRLFHDDDPDIRATAAISLERRRA